MATILTYWPYGVLAVLLLVSAYTDVVSGKVYNAAVYPAVLVGVVGHALTGGLWGGPGYLGLLGSLVGLLAGFVPMYVAWRFGAVGGGDAKLMGAVGALAGWEFALAALFFGLLVSVVMSLIAIVRAGLFVRTFKRLGRMVLLAFAPGAAIDPTGPDSPKVPLSLAFCIGSAAALIEAVYRGPAGHNWLINLVR